MERGQEQDGEREERQMDLEEAGEESSYFLPSIFHIYHI